MWTYQKVLEYPINIKCGNPQLAKFIISQYGGPDGELGASLRYLSQRFGMPDQKSKAILNDIGTEELAHLEMVGSIVHQLTKNCTAEEMEAAGLRSILYRSWIRSLPTISSRSTLECINNSSKRRSNCRFTRRFGS